MELQSAVKCSFYRESLRCLMTLFLLLGLVSTPSQEVVAQTNPTSFLVYVEPGNTSDRLRLVSLGDVAGFPPMGPEAPGGILAETQGRVTALASDRQADFVYWTERTLVPGSDPETRLFRISVRQSGAAVQFLRTLREDVRVLAVDRYNKNRLYWAGKNDGSGNHVIKYLSTRATGRVPKTFVNLGPEPAAEVLGLEIIRSPIRGRELVTWLSRGDDSGSVVLVGSYAANGVAISESGPRPLKTGLNPSEGAADLRFGSSGLAINHFTRVLSTVLRDNVGDDDQVFQVTLPDENPLTGDERLLTLDQPLALGTREVQLVAVPNVNSVTGYSASRIGNDTTVGFFEEAAGGTPERATLPGNNSTFQDRAAITFYRSCSLDVTREPDTDGDMVPDCGDDCPFFVGEVAFRGCECPDPDDSDGDGIRNCDEPREERLIPAGQDCSTIRGGERDADRDGVRNCEDECPFDPEKVEEGVCGCGIAEEPDTCLNECEGDSVNIGCGCGVLDCSDFEDGTLLLTEETRLFDEPAVAPEANERRPNKNSVRVTLQQFDQVFDLDDQESENPEEEDASIQSEFPFFAMRNSRRVRRVRVSYDVRLRELKGNRSVLAARRRLRKSELVFRNLPPGVYSVRYRAEARGRRTNRRTKETKSVTVSKTNFSPAQSFSF